MNKVICLILFIVVSIKLIRANPTKSNVKLYDSPYSIAGVSHKCPMSINKINMQKCLKRSDIIRDQMLSTLQKLNEQCQVPDIIVKDSTAMIYCCSANDLKKCVLQLSSNVIIS